MRIAIFGTGGIGGYFGGRLAQAGADVVFIARGAQLQALQTHGLRVDSIKGDVVIQPVQATADPAQVGAVDVVVLGVKAWQVPAAAAALRPLIGVDTAVLPLQNGVEAPAQLAAVLGADHVLGGLCRIITEIVAPGHIRHSGAEPYIALGELDNRPSERTTRLRTLLEHAGIQAEIPPDIQLAMWEKFLLIAAMSGIGAITRAPVGVTRQVPETRTMFAQAMREIIAVAQAHGIGLTEAAMQTAFAFIDTLPPGATASMQRDIAEGRPSELAAQNGAVVRLGQAAGVATPLHTFIYHSLLPAELQARGEI